MRLKRGSEYGIHGVLYLAMRPKDKTTLLNEVAEVLKIPKSYLTYEESLSGKGSLASEDIRFAKTIHRIQQTMIAEIKKIILIHLYCLGYEGNDLINYELELANPSTVGEKLKFELIKDKVDTCNQAIQGGLSRRWAY